MLGCERLVGELQLAIIDNTVFHPSFQLGKVISEFGKLDHSVDLTVHVAPPNQLEQMVLSAQAHIGIGFFPRRLSQLEYYPAFKSDMELYCGERHPLFSVPDEELGPEIIAQHTHAQRGYVSFDQLPHNERQFAFTARAQNIEGLAHLILSGKYLAFLPVHYARNWLADRQMRSLLPQAYAYTSHYETIRRRFAARTPAEKKFFEFLQRRVVV